MRLWRRQRRPLIFENVGLWAFFLYWFTTLINDPVVLYFGRQGVATPKQFALLAGIIIAAPSFDMKPCRSGLFARSILWLLLFYFVCVTSYTCSFLTGNVNEDYLLTLVTNGGNILWLVIVCNVLSRGVSEMDRIRFVWGMLLLGLIPLASGLYELVTQQHILSGGFSERKVGNFFWVRGFHIDKVDFVSALAPSVLLAYLLLTVDGWIRRCYLIPYFIAGIGLTFYSFSTTGCLGLTGAILSVAVLSNTRRLQTKVAFVAVCVIGVVTLTVLLDTDKGRFFKDQYTAKYERQSYLEDNPRYVYGRICLREFLHSPLCGVGFGNHVTIIYDELGGWAGGGNAHSVMSIPADLGLLGTVPFVLCFAYLYYYTWRSARYAALRVSKFDGVLIGLAASMSVFLLARFAFYFHSLADPTIFAWIVIVFAIVGPRRKFNRSVPAYLEFRFPNT